jgi:hypothetical protein
MEIQLTESQNEKLVNLNNVKKKLQSDLLKVEVHAGDMIDLILEFNGIDKSKVKALEMKDSYLIITDLEENGNE